LWALLGVTLDNAEGASLDQYGALFAFARGALDDDHYRALLRGLILARRSSGTASELQAIVRAILSMKVTSRGW
jgi:hypothetical protein